MRAALLVLGLLAGQASATNTPTVLDLRSGMTFEQVKALSVCAAPKRKGALLTCRPIKYAGRKMAVEIKMPGDSLDRVTLTLSLGTTRKAAEPVLADVLPALANDFGPLQIEGQPVTTAAVFAGLDQQKLIMFQSDRDKPVAGRFLVVQVDRWDGYYKLTLIIYRDLA